jgi:hypothetical protein
MLWNFDDALILFHLTTQREIAGSSFVRVTRVNFLNTSSTEHLEDQNDTKQRNQSQKWVSSSFSQSSRMNAQMPIRKAKSRISSAGK